MFIESEDGEIGAYTVDQDGLIVMFHPSIVLCYQFNRDGSLRQMADWERPEITSPFLCFLCDGNIENAREIIKDNCFSL